MDIITIHLFFLKYIWEKKGRYLQGKQDDSDESDPTVQAVQVGYWRVLQVVGIKGSLQPNPSKD